MDNDINDLLGWPDLLFEFSYVKYLRKIKKYSKSIQKTFKTIQITFKKHSKNVKKLSEKIELLSKSNTTGHPMDRKDFYRNQWSVVIISMFKLFNLNSIEI